MLVHMMRFQIQVTNDCKHFRVTEYLDFIEKNIAYPVLEELPPAPKLKERQLSGPLYDDYEYDDDLGALKK